MDTDVLQEIGFSKSMIDVYVALLELGPASLDSLSSKAGLPNSVVTRSLKSLMDRGLITFLKAGRDKQYQAVDPKHLLDYIDNKRRQIEDLIPELELKQQSTKERKEVETFLGKRAISLPF